MVGPSKCYINDSEIMFSGINHWMMTNVFFQGCHQMTPAFWLMLFCCTTTNEVPTSRKVGPVRSPSTSSAPFRNMEENVWWGLPSLRFWWMSRDQLMVRTHSISFHLVKLLLTWPGTFLWTGVTVRKGTEEVVVHAPVVVSSCGIFTTFQTLLPPEIQVRPGETQTLQMIDPSISFKRMTSPLMLRHSRKTRPDETRQRVIFSLHWLWWNRRGAGPHVHQLLVVQG